MTWGNTSARTPLEVYGQAAADLVAAATVVPAALSRSSCGTVVLLDITGMGAINRKHGVLVGDRYLRAVDMSLRRAMPTAAVARLAGDQFIVVLPGAAAATDVDAEDATEVVRRAVERTTVAGRWWLPVRATARVVSATWWDAESRAVVVAAAGRGLGATRRHPAGSRGTIG